MNVLKGPLAFLILPMLLAGCAQLETGSYPEIEAMDAVVIHHNDIGELIDFLAIEHLEDERRIVVESAGGEEEFLVTVLGRARHPAMQDDWAAVTADKEGFLGKITVEIDSRQVASAFGNGIRAPSPVSDTTLLKVAAEIAAGNTRYRDEPTIQVEEESEEDL